MELLPGEQRLANVEVMELLAARRKARAASKALHKRREGNFTPTKECRWVEAKALKHLRSLRVASQTRASVAAALSLLRARARSAGTLLTEAEELNWVNLPVTVRPDMLAVVLDADDRFEGPESAESLVQEVADVMFPPQLASAETPAHAPAVASAAPSALGDGHASGGQQEEVEEEGEGAPAAPPKRSKRARRG